MTWTLHKYQEDAHDFVVDRLFIRDLMGAGLLMDLGTGKTAVILRAILTLFQFGAVRRVLIVAPLRVCYNTYPEEFEKWAPGLSYTNLHASPATISRLQLGMMANDTQVHLINPDSLFKLVDLAKHYDLVVVDESSNFKKWTSEGPRGRMRSLRAMLPKIPKRVIMTATPTPESLTEFHSQAFIIDNGEALGKNVTVFRARFCTQGGWKGRKWMLREGCEKELYDLVNPLVIRIDAETHLDMPRLIENNIWISLPPEAEAQYKTLKRELALALESGDQILVGHAAALYGKLKQLAGGGVYHTDPITSIRSESKIHDEKIKALEEVIEGLAGKPAIILYQYQHELPRILPLLKRYSVINGGTPAKESEKTIKAWNARKLNFLVSHPKCLSHGLNLQSGGSDMVFFGLPDSCETYLQARARLWRQGQTEAVRIHRILAKSTVDELQSERLSGKIASQDEFLNALKQHASH